MEKPDNRTTNDTSLTKLQGCCQLFCRHIHVKGKSSFTLDIFDNLWKENWLWATGESERNTRPSEDVPIPTSPLTIQQSPIQKWVKAATLTLSQTDELLKNSNRRHHRSGVYQILDGRQMDAIPDHLVPVSVSLSCHGNPPAQMSCFQCDIMGQSFKNHFHIFGRHTSLHSTTGATLTEACPLIFYQSVIRNREAEGIAFSWQFG